jgi:hypothetical protein
VAITSLITPVLTGSGVPSSGTFMLCVTAR